MIYNIITGEKIQQICDLYIGKIEDFNYNLVIKNQTDKHLNIDLIVNYFDNPLYIFCYSHRINELSYKIKYFKNKFILITHNSDQNIELTNTVNIILTCNNLIKWYAQNLLIKNEKLHLLPIGFANSMWSHGNLSAFNDINLINSLTDKSHDVYFNFNINTNIKTRTLCYQILKNHLIWLENINPVENLYRLKQYRFCICPEGNGVDTHRLWECLYLKVVPIVINSDFTKILQKYNVPLLVLENWSDLFNHNLNYNYYNFNDDKFISLINFNKLTNNIYVW